MDVCMAWMSIATRPGGFWNDEGRRSDDETTALVQEWLLLIRTFARTSETVAGLQSTVPTTQGRLLSCGFLPAGPQDASRSDKPRKACPRIRGNRPVCHSPVAIGGVAWAILRWQQRRCSIGDILPNHPIQLSFR